MAFSVVAKRFLNVWNFLVLTDTRAVPSLGYVASAICAGLLVLLSGLGLYGLRQHRHCVTTGQRNVALGSYVLLGFGAGVVLTLAGTIGLTLNSAIRDARANDFADARVAYLETAMIENLHTYASMSPTGWQEMQNAWFCCGYYNVSAIDVHIGLDEAAHARSLNRIAGIYCGTTNCTANASPCPQRNQVWCRDVFLQNAATNNVYIGWTSLAAGVAQLFGFVLGVHILMCDVRMLQQRSSRMLAAFIKA
ncbi:hypothetical protein SPRG_05973 [Saprolegnia parasitica CBS 223.65]|uniref:Tetraspanin n=1 Tax=Saprolegnia parasitica (strain CBS 223.65) TaxID=695850 RepID=A0A067CSC5_SAPPC|nr:hypothetical protein SPRG_05973 [Saprolegnia parasitica CBS 223.65]KDO29436.1 hypothetical protein SPRG_05973 [Saprolegnia parasitica CBS 223.65]|eukprot:XP_012199936.1 hypothetical protein SPRG_05973 [Saprolegnia parasitica CBS 223.65]